eukprot:gene21696-28720_t
MQFGALQSTSAARSNCDIHPTRARLRPILSSIRQAPPEAQSSDECTLDCLKHFRKPDLDRLQVYFPPESGRQPSTHNLGPTSGARGDAGDGTPSICIGSIEVVEAGPLAPFSYFLDTAARRVSPGRLLRRCQVLSSVSLDPNSALQRLLPLVSVRTL